MSRSSPGRAKEGSAVSVAIPTTPPDLLSRPPMFQDFHLRRSPHTHMTPSSMPHPLSFCARVRTSTSSPMASPTTAACPRGRRTVT